MFEKTTDQKTESQAEAKEPVVLKDRELDVSAGGRSLPIIGPGGMLIGDGLDAPS